MKRFVSHPSREVEGIVTFSGAGAIYPTGNLDQLNNSKEDKGIA